jgi:phage terminase large subunit GpA-like protein
MLSETWEHGSGALLPIRLLAIDSGYVTSEVYAWVRRQGSARAIAIKGVERGSALVGMPTAVDITAGGRRLRRGVRVRPVVGGIAKLELFNNLRKPPPTDEEIAGGEPYPAGYVHLPKVDAEYCKQLCSEQLVTRRNRRGYPVREWVKLRERNEALDCYVYARAAAAVVGLDRFGERHWRELERHLGLREPPPSRHRQSNRVEDPAPPSGGATQPKRPRLKRRVIRSKWMG